METDSQPGSSGVVLLGRLMWFLLGPLLLLFILYAIVTVEGWFTTWDAAFGVVVALMVGGRWVEQRSGSATTATVEHFKRYVRVLLPLAAGAWVAANVLGIRTVG